MHLVIAILTCDRFELTRKTVNSLLHYNQGLSIFYGDDASTDPKIHRLMANHGIKCIMRHNKRTGCSPSSEELINSVWAATEAPFMLYLQNDFESVRPLPLGVTQQIFDQRPDVGWIRLYGLNKNNTIKGGNPTDPRNKFKPGQPLVEWKKLKIDDENIEIGDAQWSYHPAIHRSEVLRKLIKGATRERDVGIAAIRSGLLTARFMKNITNHIGIRKTTPGGKFGKPHKTYE